MLTLRGRVHSEVPHDSRRQEVHERGRSRAALVTCASTGVCRKISAATLASVHGQVCEGVAGASWCEAFVYRAIAHQRENGTIESFFCIAPRRTAPAGSGCHAARGQRCYSCGGGSTPTRFDRTVPWATGPGTSRLVY